MALDKLLENEALAEIEAIRAEARSRAAQIVAEATEKANAMVESRTRQMEVQRQAGMVRARSAADLEANAARLSANEASVSEVYGLVNQYLGGISGVGEYRDILGRLIAQAREVVPDAEAVEVNPADVGLARILVQDIAVRENPAIQGGARVVARGGKSGITNTLSGRLERLKDELAPQISRILTE